MLKRPPLSSFPFQLIPYPTSLLTLGSFVDILRLQADIWVPPSSRCLPVPLSKVPVQIDFFQPFAVISSSAFPSLAISAVVL